MPAVTLEGSLPLVTGLVLLTLAVFVFVVGRGQVYNVLFAALYLLSGIKSLGEGILPWSPELHAEAPAFPDPIFWFRLSVYCAILMLPLLVLFALTFPVPIQALVNRPAVGVLLFVPAAGLAYWFRELPLVEIGDFVTVFNAVSLVTTALAVAALLRAWRFAIDPLDRTRAAYVLAAFSMYFVGTLAVSLLQFFDHPLQGAVLRWGTPPLEMCVAAVVGYAVVRYELLGVEIHVKVGVKYAAITGALLATFFVANNTFEQVIEPIFAFTELSYLLSALVASAVFFPLQVGVSRGVNRFFPATQAGAAEYRRGRALDIYRAQVLYVLRDLDVTERERRSLDHLRRQLRVPAGDARRVESEVRRELGGRPPRRPPTRLPESRRAGTD